MSNKKAVETIRNEIADQKLTWAADENFLTALPEEAQKKYLGFTPGPGDHSFGETESLSASNVAAYESEKQLSSFGVPAAIDWRNVNGKNYVTPIKNQGGCGSCPAFAAVATVESKIKIVRGADYAVDLSEAHLFYCIGRSQGRTCSTGWTYEPTFIAFRDIGVTDEACYPYVAGDQNCTGRCSDWASRVVKITGYTKLTTIASMKEWLSTKGPLEAALSVYDDFISYSSGVYRRSANSHLQGGLLICIIGYDDAQSCWIGKNAWSTAWGDNGFFKIGYGQCGIDSQMIGVNGIVDTRWIRGKKVLCLWAINQERNAWVYLSDDGWKKISPANDDAFINTLTQLAAAKTANANVDVYLDNGLITITYVF